MSYNDETNRPTGSETVAEEREVRQLLQEAGRREPIPAERHVRLEAAARSAWEEMIMDGEPTPRDSRTWRAVVLAATLAVAVLAGWIFVSTQGEVAGGQVATVELEVGADAVGSIAAANGAETFDIAVGDELPPGVRLTTARSDSGAAGRLALRMAGGETVRVDAGSQVWLVSESRLELEAGAVYVDSASARGSSEPLEIATPFGAVRHLGTQYEVRLDASTAMRVRVREGAVSVRNNGDSWAAREGEELAVRRDGSVTRGMVAADAWSWTLAAAPVVEIRGMTLDAYLLWVVRETGWQLLYEDEALAAKAGEIILGGTIEGLRPDESVGPIVEGSGLAHSVEDGVLRISRP